MPESDRLPSSLVSLWRSVRLGYRAEPRLLVAGLVTTVAAAVPDALLAWALAELVQAVVAADGAAVLVWSLALGLLATAGWLLGIVSTRVNMRLTDRAAVDIEAHMVRMHTSVTGIEHHERAIYADRLSVLRDHASALSQLYQMLFAAVGAVLRLAIALGLLLSVRPLLVLVGLFAIPPVLVSSWRAGVEKKAEEAGVQAGRRARSIFLLGTTAEAAKEVRVAQVQQRLVEISASQWLARYRPMARARSVSGTWLSGAYALFGIALVTGVGYVADGPGSVSAVVLVVAAGSRLTQYLSQTVRETYLFRVIWLDCARRLAWLEDFAAASGTHVVGDPPDRLRSGLSLENVSFRYPGTDREVLEDITLDLPAGSVVAIVGENGAGKSTLVKLLCRFYEPTRGRILVDGIDLADVSPVAWRRRLTGAFQDFVKFEYPLREAVGVGDPDRLDDGAAVNAALGQAGAGALVAQLPHGVDTQLGASWENGVDLSHGQWQKVALARGFMRPTPLVAVLDEPTSALDAQAEFDVFERFAEMSRQGAAQGRVTVLVSHRFSTVRMADHIIVLDGSRVAEHGSHQDLMARGGLYAQLYGIQAAAYRSHGEGDA